MFETSHAPNAKVRDFHGAIMQWQVSSDVVSSPVCKLQYNSFSIPLATDGLGAKSPTIPPVFDTQITSITETKTSPSIFVFTFDAPAFFPAFSPRCNYR